MKKPYRNILVVVKQTPYEQYLQLKAQGKAPVALRWERLKNRYEQHKQCVDSVASVLQKVGATYNIIGREEMHRGSLIDKDLVIAVGGDGTVLNASSFLDDKIPMLGVNSDPTRPEEAGTKQVRDERRSRGALCAATASNVGTTLPHMLSGEITPGIRTRIRCIVKSTYTETRLPPALNDILIAHPIPAAVSRFRITLRHNQTTNATPFLVPSQLPKISNDVFSFNVWSSGMWVCTATGSTAAMYAAGGQLMDIRSNSLQYLVREPLSENEEKTLQDFGRGLI
eukprot:gene14706-31270_t